MAPEWITAHRAATEETFGVFRRTPREALRFATIIVHAVVVEAHHDVEAVLRDAVEHHGADYRAAVMRQGFIARGPHGRTRWAFAYELDLLIPGYVCSPMKSALLAKFGIDVGALGTHQRIVLLHTHGLIDIRGHASVKALAYDLRRACPGPRRVHLAEIYETGTVAENVARIAEYSAKFRFRYCRAWSGGRTEFLADYEPEWRAFVVRCYEAIGPARLLNANVATQALGVKAPAEMYAAAPNSVGEIVDSAALQLGTCEAGPQQNTQHDGTRYSDHMSTDEGSSRDDRRTMKAKEIIDDYIDPSRIAPEFRRELEDALEREGPNMSPAAMSLMYADGGDERVELELAQRRADLAKTRAEVGKLKAAAVRDRAEARRARATASGEGS